MLTEANLQELLDFQAQHTLLSVYLNTDQTQAPPDRHKLRLRGMLKNIDLPDDIVAVEKYIEHDYDWRSRSVAIFSCAPENYFRAYPMAVTLQSRARTGQNPHVKPLANLLDFYGGYGVVLVDKQGARVFYFHLGELIEQEGFMGEEVRHTKRGGSSSLAGRRGGATGHTNYVEEVTERNIKDAAEFTTRFFNENDVRRIVIGGAEDTVAQFRSLLPKSWQSLVVGTVPISMSASKNEILDRAMEIGRKAEIRHEDKLVSAVKTNAAKEQGGVIGLDDTLQAVHDGRVQTLVLQEDYRAPGYQCMGCEFITSQELDTCPYCGNKFNQIQDAVELAVRKALQAGGEVEFIQSEPAQEVLGGIGALLRY
jgi:peptide subunit release factor 1 (eRF1)